MNTNKLPEMCYQQLPSTGELILIKRGEKGFWYAGYPGDYKLLNETIEVTELQAEAMLNGSMFGWNVPGADPDFLEDMRNRKKA